MVHYYRARPDKFIEDIIGIKLNYYQKLMVRAFFKYNYVCFVQTRGLGKSFTGMLSIVAYCLLYPNTRAGIIAPSFRQGKMLIQEKYKDEFCGKFSPFLEQEEKSFKCNNQTAKVEWHNGSSMEAFPIGIGSDQNAGSKIRGKELPPCLVTSK